MALHPILSFRKTKAVAPKVVGGGGGPAKFPSYNRQAQRLKASFSALEKSVKIKSAELRANPSGVVQEQVLVLRTVGSVSDFAAAVSTIQGMEWLGEFDEEDIPADEEFHKLTKADKSKKDDPLSGRLYLVMSNHQAMQELLAVWSAFEKNPNKPLKAGLAGWKQLFKHLKEIRLWDVRDRFEETGAMEDWRYQVKAGTERIRFQLEPWFKIKSTDRAQVTDKIRELLEREGGKIISQYALPEIAYQGFLGELPIASVKKILAEPTTKILHCEYIMFARPLAQGIVAISDAAEVSELEKLKVEALPVGDPQVALFDGLPIQNHSLLKDRLIISDPDNFTAEYQAKDRVHGTAMASSIIYGGRLDGSPIANKLYVRPVLKPGLPDFNGVKRERIPADMLEVDLLHRAVLRLFNGPDGQKGDAPTVKVINYSIGDPIRQFDHFLSPVARLIDWLSWQYNVLFILSAGNHAGEIALSCEKEAFKAKGKAERQALALGAIIENGRNRRLLSPAESMNALTIGAANSDGSAPQELPARFPIFSEALLPSPYSANGLGFRRSIKPDILVPGGRMYFREKIDTHANVTLQPDVGSSAPGHKLAAPGAGTASHTSFHRGTSFSAGIACHFADKLLVNLRNLSAQDSGITEEYFAVLVKALLVHSASWGIAKEVVFEIIKDTVKKTKHREFISRLLGYGTSNFDRILNSTDQRATLVACDSIANGQAHLFEIPLPKDLSGKKEWRQLTVTLAWLTPVNPLQRPYRKAALWLSNSEGDDLGKTLKIDRYEADYKAAMRGTVQHELLAGEKAVSYTDATSIKIQVNCREDATTLVERIRYGLVVTLEVKEGVAVQVYNQIKTKIAARAKQPIKP